MASALEQNAMPLAAFDDLKAGHSSSVEHKEYEDIHHLTLTSTLTSRISNRMKFFSAWIAFGGWLVNFDLGYSGIVFQMQPFNHSFGSCGFVPVPHAPKTTTVYKCSLSAKQQSVVSIYLLFMALGAGLSAVAGSYLGRKGVIRLGCAIITIGAAGMLGTAGTFAGYIACKFISGFGTGLVVATGPVYAAECTPSKKRGILVALYTVGLGLGSVTVALVCLGSHHLRNDWSWKIPILCQIPVAVIYAIGLVMFPESPRWCLVMGKEEQARKAISRFYNRDAHSEEVTTQVLEIEQTIELEKALSSGVPWLEIFQPRYLRRTLTSAFCIIAGTLSGINFVIPYATIFLAGIGIKNPFEITVFLNICILAGSAVGPIPCQYLGRRRSFLVGFASMAICMLIFAAVNSGLGTSHGLGTAAGDAASKVLIAFLCIWCFLYTCFFASTSWLASAEQHSVRHRTYGQAFATLIGFTFNFASNFWTPYMINKNYGNMGTNVGYFYLGMLVIILTMTFFILPETGNLTLEEIDSYYTSGVKPWHTSLKKNNNKAT